MRDADWSLYLVTDRRLAGSLPLEEVVAAAVRGGVTAVQLREKETATREFVQLARRLRDLLRPTSIPLLINDRVDVALAAGADGVHIGQSDMEYSDARRLLGPDSFIGLSVETMEQAREAEELDVDYIAVSPMFRTRTKLDTAPPWGLEGLRSLRGRTRHRIVAIGGISQLCARQVMEAGASGIAVVSAICSAPDPELAARELRARVESARAPAGENLLHH